MANTKPETSTRTFCIGDRVAIINCTQGGRFMVEGYASIVKAHTTDGYYRVRFEGGGDFDRFVDPAAQDDPQAFAAELNKHVR